MARTASAQSAFQASRYQENRSPSRKLRMPSCAQMPPCSRLRSSSRSLAEVGADTSFFRVKVPSGEKDATISAASIFMKMA